jgi:hypothetical protein
MISLGLACHDNGAKQGKYEYAHEKKKAQSAAAAAGHFPFHQHRPNGQHR